jgi:hypothetical protein
VAFAVALMLRQRGQIQASSLRKVAMSGNNPLRNVLARFRRQRRRRSQPNRFLRRASLQLEQLEGRLVPSNTGTIHLTDSTATVVEETHYAAKPDVYLYGNKLTDGYYDVEVVAPGGKSGNADDVLGLSDPNHPVQVVNGHFFDGIFSTDPAPGLLETVDGPRGHAFNVWDVVYSTGNTNSNPPAGSQGYDDTDNNGGEYQVVIAQHIDGETQDNFPQFTGNSDVTKSKNFKAEPATQATSIVTNFILTQPDGSTVTGPNPGGTTAVAGSTAQDFATVTVKSGTTVVNEGTADFQLFGPSGLIDDSEAPVVNGTATDPFISDQLPAGNYYFVAAFSDGNDFGESQSTDELFTIDKASPTITTTANPTGTVNVGANDITVGDSAVVSGGYGETGNLIFTLHFGSSAGPEVAGSPISMALHGDDTYSVSTTLSASSQAGTYVWTVTYAGDGNNSSAQDQADANEQFTIRNVVCTGESANQEFWGFKSGRMLVDSAQWGGKTGKALGNWLAGNWSNLFGNLAGATNDQVVNYYHLLLMKNIGKDVTSATARAALSTALSIYATTTGLGWGTASQADGFMQGFGGVGLGDESYNVGSHGASFGAANDIYLTVNQLMSYLDSQTAVVTFGSVKTRRTWNMYGGNLTLLKGAKFVFFDIARLGWVLG